MKYIRIRNFLILRREENRYFILGRIQSTESQHNIYIHLSRLSESPSLIKRVLDIGGTQLYIYRRTNLVFVSQL